MATQYAYDSKDFTQRMRKIFLSRKVLKGGKIFFSRKVCKEGEIFFSRRRGGAEEEKYFLQKETFPDCCENAFLLPLTYF